MAQKEEVANNFLIYKGKMLTQLEFDELVKDRNRRHEIRHAMVEFYIDINQDPSLVYTSRESDNANIKTPIKFTNLKIKCARPHGKWLCVNLPSLAQKNGDFMRLYPATSFKIPNHGSGYYKISIKCSLTTNSAAKTLIGINMCKINLMAHYQTFDSVDNALNFSAEIDSTPRTIYFSETCYLSDKELYGFALQTFDNLTISIYAATFTIRFKRVHCIQRDTYPKHNPSIQPMPTMTLTHFMSAFVRGTWGVK